MEMQGHSCTAAGEWKGPPSPGMISRPPSTHNNREACSVSPDSLPCLSIRFYLNYMPSNPSPWKGEDCQAWGGQAVPYQCCNYRSGRCGEEHGGPREEKLDRAHVAGGNMRRLGAWRCWVKWPHKVSSAKFQKNTVGHLRFQIGDQILNNIIFLSVTYCLFIKAYPFRK